MTVLPTYFVPAPAGLFPKTNDAREAGKQGDRWLRALTLFWDMPPTESRKSGYFCQVFMCNTGSSTGVFKIGLQYKWTLEGLKEDALACEMDWPVYLKRMEAYWGEPLLLKPQQPPYVVDLNNKTCTCPDFVKRQLPCCHLVGTEYAMAYGQPLLNRITGIITFAGK